MEWIFIIATTIISYVAWQSNELLYKLMFNAYQVEHRKQYYKFITHGFVHADWTHLIFNMLGLYFFGGYTIYFYGVFNFILLYITGIIISSVPYYLKHKNDHYKSSLGASGGVSAVIMSTVIIDPWQKFYLYFAIGIPAILFAIGYLWYSHYMSKKNMDNIGHDAHLVGGLYGLIFPALVDVNYYLRFFELLMNPTF